MSKDNIMDTLNKGLNKKQVEPNRHGHKKFNYTKKIHVWVKSSFTPTTDGSRTPHLIISQ